MRPMDLTGKALVTGASGFVGSAVARKLTERGRAKMRRIAAGMRTAGLKFEVILPSPLARATETAEIVAAAYANTPTPQVVPALATGVAPSEVVAALKPFARHDHVMIVGHEPQLSALEALLLTGSPGGFSVDLKKGGCVALGLPARSDKGGAQLHWMLTPRQLRRMRK